MTFDVIWICIKCGKSCFNYFDEICITCGWNRKQAIELERKARGLDLTSGGN